MIYRLQRKFILICTVSVLSVILVIFGMICALNINSMNRNLDILADTVSDGGGKFPSNMGGMHKREDMPPNDRGSGFITPETPFATRHFTVLFDDDGNAVIAHTDSIASVNNETAIEYAKNVASRSSVRGWYGNYRYKVFSIENGKGVVFIDGSMSRSTLLQSLTISGLVLLGCAALVLIMIALLSRRVVKPIAESYEKQKQFVTDANHELKTPLTLILANLDIAEAELGSSEWLDDIRIEGHRMTELVNQLVALSRMDEEAQPLCITRINVSEMVADAASEFKLSAESKGKKLYTDISPNVIYDGDETLLLRLISVLLDNAVKYCDNGGEITVKLQKHRRIYITVENTYASVTDIELGKLFDRFYRADKARTFTGGYGIGLSIAKAIVEKHKGSIAAYKKDSTHIGFKVIL